MPYVLIIVSEGDGDGDQGRRVTSVRFETKQAAEETAEWLNKNFPYCRMFLVRDER